MLIYQRVFLVFVRHHYTKTLKISSYQAYDDNATIISVNPIYFYKSPIFSDKKHAVHYVFPVFISFVFEPTQTNPLEILGNPVSSNHFPAWLPRRPMQLLQHHLPNCSLSLVQIFQNSFKFNGKSQPLMLVGKSNRIIRLCHALSIFVLWELHDIPYTLIKHLYTKKKNAWNGTIMTMPMDVGYAVSRQCRIHNETSTNQRERESIYI